jgi:uncharacterized protein (TIGR02598 family)
MRLISPLVQIRFCRVPRTADRLFREAFTLIEVVLAIALITFAIIGLIGLFAVGLRADQRASDDTAFAAMASRIIAQLSAATNSAALQNLAATNYSFDASGMPTTNTQSVYNCNIILSQTNLPTFTQGKITLVTLQFTWPPIAHPPNTNTLNATLPLSY